MYHRRHKFEQSSNPKLLKCIKGGKAGCGGLKPAPYALFPNHFTHYCLPSPTGICLYNREEDICCDDCLYCHQPYERK